MNQENLPMQSKVVYLMCCDKEHSLLQTNKKISVPAYQRPYSWKEKQIEEFISTLKAGISSQSPIFMGTIQLDKKESSNDTEYDIVDGQQRITTFLLLIYLLELVTEQFDITKEKIQSAISFANKSQQTNWEEALNNCNTLYDIDAIETNNKGSTVCDEKNPYIRNLRLLRFYLEDQQEKSMLSKEYASQLLSVIQNVYFVELTTFGMKLSEIVDIFHSINSTGLDLNSADTFKIQFYDYLKKDTKNKDTENNLMNKIQECYEEIAKPESEMSMDGVLSILKYIIIAKSSFQDIVSQTQKSNTLFFDEYFNSSQTSQKNCGEDLDIFKRVVDTAMYLAEYVNKRLLNEEPETADSMVATLYSDLIWHTRYGSYWVLPYVDFYFRTEKKDKLTDDDALKSLINCANAFKYLAVFSVIYAKRISPVNRIICSTLPKIANKENWTKDIEDKISYSPYDEKVKNTADLLSDHLKNDLYFNHKRCHLVCILSELIEHENSSSSTSVKDLRENLFKRKDNKYDIEHIVSREKIEHEEDVEKRRLFNGIGNLILLEEKKNRSIKNKDFSKKREEYKKSKFLCAKDEISEQTKWEIDEVASRAAVKTAQLLNFFSLKPNNS